MLALGRADVILSRNNYTSKVTVCPEKNAKENPISVWGICPTVVADSSKHALERPRCTSSFLVHPDAPGDPPGFLIAQRAARQLEGQLDLTVMVCFVPEHMLEQGDGVVVMKVHPPTCVHSTLYGVPHRLGAIVQPLRDTTRVKLGDPFLLGYLSGKLRSVFEDEHKPYIVDVCEQLRDGWAALHRPDLQPALRESTEQVDQDGVVPIPRVQQSLKQGLVWHVRHIHFDSDLTAGRVFGPSTDEDSIPTMIGLSSRKSHCGLAWQGRTITEQLPSAARSYMEGAEGLAH